MSDFSQQLVALDRQIKSAAIALSDKDLARFQAISVDIDWATLASEFETVSGRYQSAVYRYGKRIIRNLRRPYMLYADCVALAITQADLVSAIKDSPSLRDRAQQELADALDWAVCRESTRGNKVSEAFEHAKFETLDELFACVDAKLQQGSSLEESSSTYRDGERIDGRSL